MTRLHVLQPALPAYRRDFFERLSAAFGEAFILYYTPGQLGALAIGGGAWARPIGPIRTLAPGLFWQAGALAIPLRRGDTLVAPGDGRTLSTLLLALRARLTGTKVIFWSQYWSADSNPARQRIRLWLGRLAHALLFYTTEEAAAYRATDVGRIDRRRCEGLDNGLDLVPIAAARTDYDAAARDRALLFIGRFTDKARIAILLDALADPRLDGVTLHVVGDGASADTLKLKAEDLGLGARVRWHGAATNEAAIAAVANRCRLFVYPGAVGLSLVHGLAFGLPALVHDQRRRHMPEIAALRAGENGWTFAMDDPSALATAIADHIDNFVGLNSASARAIAVVEDRFNTARMAQRAIRFLREVAAASRDSRGTW